MKKLCLLALCACCLFQALPLMADCGKTPVVPFSSGDSLPPPANPMLLQQTVKKPNYGRDNWTTPDYNQSEDTKHEQQVTLDKARQEPENIDEDGSVPPPKPTGSVAMFGDDKTFFEGNQQAVIAWNGYEDSDGEEILILTTNEKSAKKQPIAALSILPLPGKPISVERANTDVFVKAKILFDKKLTEKRRSGQSGSFGAIMNKKIGSHHIFVWKMDDVDDFESEINRYVANTYRQNARTLFSNESFQIIRKYYERGFRYFAFDLTLIDKTTSTKEAIAYRFKTRFLYFPLEISKIGGTGRTTVDLFVITPGSIRLSGVIDENSDTFVCVGNSSVDFTQDELESIEPGIVSVFSKDQRTLRARNFIFSGPIDGFDGDFMASSH